MRERRGPGGRVDQHEEYMKKLYGNLILCNPLRNIIRKILKSNFPACFNNAALMSPALLNKIKAAAYVPKTIQAFAIALGCPSKLDNRILLLKIPVLIIFMSA